MKLACLYSGELEYFVHLLLHCNSDRVISHVRFRFKING